MNIDWHALPRNVLPGHRCGFRQGLIRRNGNLKVAVGSNRYVLCAFVAPADLLGISGGGHPVGAFKRAARAVVAQIDPSVQILVTMLPYVGMLVRHWWGSSPRRSLTVLGNRSTPLMEGAALLPAN